MTKEAFDIIISISTVSILVITAYFMYRSLRSPVDAVQVGRRLNNEQQKDTAKRNLFLLLFSLRGNPVHYDFVRGLNEIDIVFEDTADVLNAWHIHYDSLQIENLVNEDQIWSLQRTNLLSAMALSLGYSRIRQTDMIRSYYPKGHSAQLQHDLDLRRDLTMYLKSGIEMQEML